MWPTWVPVGLIVRVYKYHINQNRYDAGMIMSDTATLWGKSQISIPEALRKLRRGTALGNRLHPEEAGCDRHPISRTGRASYGAWNVLN